MHCACKAVNRGTGRAIIGQTKACGVPIIKGTRVSAGLKRRQELDTRRKLSKRSLVDKKRRRARQKRTYEMYDHNESKKCYQKGKFVLI